MRVWRFDEDGKTKDAVRFLDTFALYDSADRLFMHLHLEETYHLNQMKEQQNADYICQWQGFFFPVHHRDTITKELLTDCYNRAKADNNGYNSKMNS